MQLKRLRVCRALMPKGIRSDELWTNRRRLTRARLSPTDRSPVGHSLTLAFDPHLQKLVAAFKRFGVHCPVTAYSSVADSHPWSPCAFGLPSA
jgi:hypothetical protein